MLQINLYNPGTLSKQILIDNFIIGVSPTFPTKYELRKAK